MLFIKMMTSTRFLLDLHFKHRTNMRYLSLLFLLFLSQLSNGQHVVTQFDRVVLYDDFTYISNRWEQKNSGSETFVISDNYYTVKRIKETFFSVSLAKDTDPFEAFELVSLLRVVRSKSNKNASGGLIFKAQELSSDALLVEINTKRQYRISLMQNGEFKHLTGDKNDGWKKSNVLHSDDFNEIKIVTYGNVYDVYFNKTYVDNFIDATLGSGRVGFYTAPQSTLQVDYIIQKTKIEKPSFVVVQAKTEEEKKKEEDPTYTALAKAFTAKSEKLQEELNQLKEELYRCQSDLTLDTASQRQNIELKKENTIKTQRIIELEQDIDSNKQRLAYLESLREAVESDVNGDLILHLTELLSAEKKKSDQLAQEIKVLKIKLNEQK
ncbi:MAG: hypothetical protein ACI8ZN_002581 [Bacteroidia bacterium]|jgi:hypothetical protein